MAKTRTSPTTSAPSTEAPGTAVLVEQVEPGITKLTLNRPERLNAMSHGLIDDLHAALDAVIADRTCRVVVLTGAGRGFCAGLDLAETSSDSGDPQRRIGTPAGGMRAQQRITSLVTRMRGLPHPIVAAVNGAAAGGGFALALASDIRIADTTARFNAAFVKLGVSGCDIGVSWLLPRIVGAGKAFDHMLTGRLIDASEADAMGLVSRVVPQGQAVDAALETARLIAANSPFGVWMTKEVMWANLEVGSLGAAIDLENRTQILSTMTGDLKEAAAAFIEKRPPKFTPI
jgi:enoyl-CoA hydratase